jgi:hypothetical protein
VRGSTGGTKILSPIGGLDYRPPGTSHVVFSFPGLDPLSVPAKKPIKPIYVRLFVTLIDQILEARQ